MKRDEILKGKCPREYSHIWLVYGLYVYIEKI